MTDARRVLAAYAEQPGNAGIWQELLIVRRELAAVIAALPTAHKTGPLVEAACSVLHEFEQSGSADQPAASEDLALVAQYQKRNWPGLLASMLLVPAWQSPDAPSLDVVQPWLWAEYARWLCYTPKGFTACGQLPAFTAHYLKRLEELANWGSRNRGSTVVKQALEEYMKVGGCACLEMNTGSLRRHAECRAKILKAVVGVAAQDDLMPFERTGRRLRVGFIIPDLDLSTGTFTALPLFEQLDPERFEAVIFTQRIIDGTVEDYIRAHAWEFYVLPKESEAQIDSIRAASLDVVVFCADLTNGFSDLTRLALQRLAALQVVTNVSLYSSGFPEIDLYISGASVEPSGAAAHYSERLGLLPGSAQTFSFEIDNQEPSMEWTRAALGLPDEATVFVTTADYRRITPEVQESWVRLLGVVPGSRLLVHPFRDVQSASQAAKRFCADFDRRLSSHGVADDRLVIMPAPFASRADVKAFLRVADIYLDTFPVGSASGLVDPLEIGLPVVVCEGEASRSRRGSALLRTLGLPELIASNSVEYEAIAARLAVDPVLRQACAGRVCQQMKLMPVFLDTLASSDAFGELIEKGYDELVEEGRAAFRANPIPLSATLSTPDTDASSALSPLALAQKALRAAPSDTTARHALGRVLLDAGRSARAVTYLLAALQGGENNPVLWRDLAVALRADGKRNQAIEAIESCLRLDPSQAEGWLMLIDLAESSGAADFARESLEALRANVPDHPDIPIIAARLGC